MRAISPIRVVLLTLLALPFLYPFWFLVSTSLKSFSEFTGNQIGAPREPTFASLSSAWTDAQLGPAMLNSLVTVTTAVVLTVSFAAAAAFWFVRHDSRFTAVLRYGLILTMAFPAPVFIIPLFVILSDWQLTDSRLVLGVVYAGWCGSFGLYLVYSYFKSLPDELLEAPAIDGATALQTLRFVFLPLSGPVLATLAVLTFVWTWGDLLIAVVLVQDPTLRLVTPATTLLADEVYTDIPKNAAGVLIALLPMFVVFLLGQRYLVRGLLAGVGR